MLANRIGGADRGRVLRSLVKITAASLVMGAAAYGAELGLHAVLPGTGVWVRIVRVFGAMGAGVAVLALSAWVLRIEEFSEATRRILVRAKLR
jgi:hypothetical protein